jgi:hypothetical protein
MRKGALPISDLTIQQLTKRENGMKKQMGFLAVLIVFVAMLAGFGCAGTGVTPAPAPVQQVVCSDAQTAYNLADQMLNTQPPISAEAAKYWNAYKAGAQLGIDALCGAAAAPVAAPAVTTVPATSAVPASK